MELNPRALSAFGKSASLILRRAVWACGAIAAAALFFFMGLLFRVLIGPVSLGPFSGELRDALNQVLPGLDVRFDEAALEWERTEGRIDLVIRGTRVLDRGQHIIAQAPKAEIGLAVGPFLHGKIAVNRIALVGVQLTLVHTKAGSWRLGLQSANSDDDVLRRIKDAISRGGGTGPALKSVAVRDARLAFYDEESGTFIVAPKADLQVFGPRNNPHEIFDGMSASLVAQVEVAGKSTELSANARFSSQGDISTGDISINGLDLQALARDGKKFGVLAPLALTADVSGSWTLMHGTELKSANFGIGASGYINGLGRPLHVRSLRLAARYDGQTGKLLIDDATLAGEEAQAHLTGDIGLNFAPSGGMTSVFSLAVNRIGINVPGALEHAVNLGHASIVGGYSSADKTIELKRIDLSGGALSTTLSGRVVLAADQSPELDFDGKVDPISLHDLLAYWPLNVAPGAREWISTKVEKGQIGLTLIHTEIPAGAFDLSAIPDNAISIAFPIQGATINYLKGLTPLTNVMGSGVLTGDNFKADVASAVVGPLSLTKGHVAIANLHIHGTPAVIDAHIAGGLPQLFALLDMKPLQYPTRFHVNTSSSHGNASLDASFRVPTIRGESVDAIGISVKGVVSKFGIALAPHTKISDGSLQLAVDNAKLHAAGNVVIGGTPLDVDWLEIFKPNGPVSTTVNVHGVLDDAARSNLGLSLGSFLTGPIGATAHLTGYRGTVQAASIDADLTQAILSADVLAWRKPAGVPSSAHVVAQMAAGGSFRSANVAIQGTSITASANLGFGSDGGVESVSAPVVRAGAGNDFAVTMKKRLDGGEDFAITGHSLDASGLLKRKSGAGPTRPATAQSPEPFHLTAYLDKVVLHDDAALSPFSLDMTGVGQHPRTFSVKAGLTKTASLSVNMTASNGQRHLTANAEDAGTLVRTLLNYQSLKGGELSLDATAPMTSPESQKSADYSGELVIRNATLLNQPFIARLFSSGSPGGLVDLMQGQGIVLDRVHIPFRLNDDVITVHDATATGPSIGLTADGFVDRTSNQISLQGAVAPMYGLNGLLGSIPVLGDVFVSKKGEGIFGITYTMRGDLDQPKISTNPLSVLAPGILRRIFEGKAPTGPSTSAAPSPARPQ